MKVVVGLSWSSESTPTRMSMWRWPLTVRGVRLGELHTVATTHGYEELERWSRGLGEIHAFGIEGTGSYGAGVARFLTSRGYNGKQHLPRPDTPQGAPRRGSPALARAAYARGTGPDGGKGHPDGPTTQREAPMSG